MRANWYWRLHLHCCRYPNPEQSQRCAVMNTPPAFNKAVRANPLPVGICGDYRNHSVPDLLEAGRILSKSNGGTFLQLAQNVVAIPTSGMRLGAYFHKVVERLTHQEEQAFHVDRQWFHGLATLRMPITTN